MGFRYDKSSIEAVLFSLVMYQRMHTTAKKSHITMRKGCWKEKLYVGNIYLFNVLLSCLLFVFPQY